ncbi:MAG: aminotransferase, partial [Cytophagales bacterium]|nr:aminotransferase [Cytophagales bacterium]
LQGHLTKNNIRTLIHYPVPPYLQKAYNDLGYSKGDFPITEVIAETCLSLPVYPGLKDEEVVMVCDVIKEFFH